MKKTIVLSFILYIIGLNNGFSQVGVGTENPTADFHVKSKTNQVYDAPTQAYPADVTTRIEGNLVIDNPGEYDTDAVPLSWNPKTHEVTRSVEDQKKLMSFATYTIKRTDQDEWIANFNTLIPSDKYTVIIYDVRLSGEDLNGNEQEIFIGKPNTDTTSKLGSVQENVSPFIQNGTWRIEADYPRTVPYLSNTSVQNSVFTWRIELMIINKSLSEYLGQRNITLNSNAGSDTNPFID